MREGLPPLRQYVRSNYTDFLHPLPSNLNLHHSRPGEFIAIRSFIFITLNEQAYCRARSNSRTQNSFKLYNSPGVHGAQWLEHLTTGDTEVVGSIPTWNSEDLFSTFFSRCRATRPSLTHRCIERRSSFHKNHRQFETWFSLKIQHTEKQTQTEK